MTTQIIEAGQGIITTEIAKIAEMEGINSNILRERVARGSVVILKNRTKTLTPTALGFGLSPKICARVNNNFESFNHIEETDKIKISKIAGAKVVFDISSNSEYGEMREKISSEFDMPYGVNPLLESLYEAHGTSKLEIKSAFSKILENVEMFCEQGADFITIYPTINSETVKLFKQEMKNPNLISKQASILAEYVSQENAQNPYYEMFDEILDIARTYDVVVSLASVFSFNSLSEFPLKTSYSELLILAELVQRARAAGVQTMIEASGYMPLSEISSHLKLVKKLTAGAPLILDGPKVAEDNFEVENINSAIGASTAIGAGCDMLFALNNEDNSKKQNARQLRENVLSLKVAADAGSCRSNL